MKRETAQTLIKVALAAGMLLILVNGRENIPLSLLGYLLSLPAFWLLELK